MRSGESSLPRVCRLSFGSRMGTPVAPPDGAPTVLFTGGVGTRVTKIDHSCAELARVRACAKRACWLSIDADAYNADETRGHVRAARIHSSIWHREGRVRGCQKEAQNISGVFVGRSSTGEGPKPRNQLAELCSKKRECGVVPSSPATYSTEGAPSQLMQNFSRSAIYHQRACGNSM